MFDTDTLSNLMKRTPSQQLLAKIQMVPVDDQFTSSITLGEMTYGAEKKGSPRMLGEIRRILAHLEILPFDAASAIRYGAVRAELESRGILIGDADTRIAAIALVRGLIVVTNNVRHFGRVPNLAVQNWL